MTRLMMLTITLIMTLAGCGPQPEQVGPVAEATTAPTATPTATPTETPQPTDVPTATLSPVASPVPTGWDAVAIGETLYARVKYLGEEVAPVLYKAPTTEAETFNNKVMDYLPTSPTRISTRYAMAPFATYRITKVSDDFAQLLPDNDIYSPFGHWSENVYAQLDILEPILDYSAFNLFEDTQNADKLIVVVRDDDPEVLMIEGSQIISWTPAILGGSSQYNSNTPLGDYRLSMYRASRHMAGHPGVGFSMFFSRLEGLAIHDNYWWRWDQINEGFYDSAGCVNIPNELFGSAIIHGEGVPLAEFMYRWSSTNLDYDERVEEEVITEWNEPGYWEAETTIRLLIVPNINALQDYAEYGSVEWSAILEQYNSYESGGWFLPEYPWEGGHAPIPTTPDNVGRETR